jgi:hypothetical protein
LSAGVDANIQPEKTRLGAWPRCESSICRKAEVSGGSSGGTVWQIRAVMTREPKRTGTPTGAFTSMARPVILSSPRKTTIRFTLWASGMASATPSTRGTAGVFVLAGASANAEPAANSAATDTAKPVFTCYRLH